MAMSSPCRPSSLAWWRRTGYFGRRKRSGWQPTLRRWAHGGLYMWVLRRQHLCLVPCGIIPTLSQAHCRSHNRAVRASHAVCIHYASSRAYALFQESYVPGLEKAGATLQTKAGQVHLLPPSISMPSLGETSYWEGRSQSKSVGMPNRIALFHREIFSLPRTVTTPKIPDRCWLLSRRRSLW